MSDINTEQLLREVVRRILQEVNPAQIILFGSRARSEAGADADLDLLVVQDEPFGPGNPWQEQHRRLRRRLAGLGIAKDILLCSRDVVEKWRTTTNHVIARALREGRVLYERH